MTNTRKIAELSRQELYELIWSLPAIKVAANFGISDVAVHKRCIKLQVPRPTRGYWAKVAAGQKPHKKPLPPTADEVFAKLVRRPIGKALSLPEAGVPLHPVAAELLQAIVKAKLDSQKRARISARTLPEVVISKNLADRVAKAFHVILTGLEPLGILFQKSLSTSQIGYFKRGQDRLYCYLEETRVDMFGTERRVQWWSSQECGLPSGRLIFSFKTAIYGNNEEKQWAETRRVSLEKVLARIVSGIRQHFLDMQKKHIQEAIENKIRQAEYEQRFREWQAAEEIRKQTEREQKHVEALKSVIDTRRRDLINAAEWWGVSHSVKRYIDDCESRWKAAAGELTSDQTAWLSWANEIACSLSPFSVGYPDALQHGAFDPTSIPFGGPYPSARNFAKTPSLPIIQCS